MKKTIIGVLFIGALVATAAPSFASTCICLGIGTSGSCGSGALGASFPQKYSSSDANVFAQYIKSAKAQANFTSLGKSFDGRPAGSAG